MVLKLPLRIFMGSDSSNVLGLVSLTSPSLCDFVQLSTCFSQKPSGRSTITDTALDPEDAEACLIHPRANLQASR